MNQDELIGTIWIVNPSRFPEQLGVDRTQKPTVLIVDKGLGGENEYGGLFSDGFYALFTKSYLENYFEQVL